MPRKFRQSKRRQTTSDAWLAWAIGEHVDQSDQRWEEYIGFEYFLTDDEIAAVWKADGDRVIAAWTANKPGSRPHLWWLHDAPEDRLRLSGAGPLNSSPLRRNGVPRMIVTAEMPAVYESQAAYLDRLGLFLPGERKRLSAADFEPEIAT